MSKPILYYAPFSPPARACMITAKLIGLDFELKFVDFGKKEHLSEEFIKINPQHTIPVLIDNDATIWDSHAILAYIVAKYAKDDSLYPKDLIKRAHVDQRLHFENGNLFQVIKDFVQRIIYEGETEYNEKSIKAAHNVYELLEKFLIDDYLVGNQLTIADISMQTSVISLRHLVPVTEKYPRINLWLKRLEVILPENDFNEEGAKELYDRIKGVLEQNKKK